MKIIFLLFDILLVYYQSNNLMAAMNETYRLSLINNLEKNIKDFQLILNKIPESPEVDSLTGKGDLKDFFCTVTAVEEDVLKMRLKKIVEEEHPYLPAIQVEKLKIAEEYYQYSLTDLVRQFLVQKEEILKFINKIPYYYWERTGVHELEGHVTFEEFVQRLIRNDQINLNQLKEKFKNNRHKKN